MGEKNNIFILGDGRIGQAVSHYLTKYKVGGVNFLTEDKSAARADLLIGALAGGLGWRSLSLALKYKKPLIDISDLDPEFYFKQRRAIEKNAITVIAGCGFCPGLVNFILGREIASRRSIRSIEVKAGSLSHTQFFYPFLWCFEDLMLEHQIPSYQVISSKKIKFPPFAGYQKEKYFGIDAESYFSASGFENLLEETKVEDFTCRVVRPYGFMAFFQFLKNQGFLKKENAGAAKQILEAGREDNLTLAEITVKVPGRKVVWQMKSAAGKQEKLNSMQKITAAAPAAMAALLLKGKIRGKGILFMEGLGKDAALFKGLLEAIRREGIWLRRKEAAY